MNKLEEMLRSHRGVDDYKINKTKTEGYQLFFVKGMLETVRYTDNSDVKVTVYVLHDGKIGDADFPVFPSTTDDQLRTAITEAVEKARLINNTPFALPDAETLNAAAEDPSSNIEDIAAMAANTIFDACTDPGNSLNSVEVFVDRKTISVINSRGLNKTQVRVHGMAEIIPTYNGETQSVELYDQYHFAGLDSDALFRETAEMLQAAKARYNAAPPEDIPHCPIVLHHAELHTLFNGISRNLDYSTVYAHAGVFRKGAPVQVEPKGDLISITMCGSLKNDPKSSLFDSDGVALSQQQIIRDGIAVNYYGSSRFGQYLNEEPTGILPCLQVSPGSAEPELFTDGEFLEILSMSGLQVDFFSDYIGGEIRLAYLHNGADITPLTGISFSGSLKEALSGIRLSQSTVSNNGYCGPEKAMIYNMKIY